MIEKVKRLLTGETLRYLIFGVLTVIVNTVSFKLLNLMMGDIAANTVAFFIAVLFAYWTNSQFVFRTGMAWRSFAEFMAMRICTLPIDDGGMWLLLKLGVNDLIAKVFVNAVIIILNYLASKLFIFKKK